VAKQTRPLVTKFVCVCGQGFTSQTDLERHERDARRLAWQDKREAKTDVFKTPPPRYSVDDELRGLAVAIARQ
jgi:hypothetical protein